MKRFRNWFAVVGVVALLGVLVAAGNYTYGTGARIVKIGVESGVIDAFGSVRVSNKENIFLSKMLYDKLPVFWDEQIWAL